jgi:hypothetical protein
MKRKAERAAADINLRRRRHPFLLLLLFATLPKTEATDEEQIKIKSDHNRSWDEKSLYPPSNSYIKLYKI